MSKPAPPKQNMWQMILFVIVIFLGFRMLFPEQQPQDQRSPTEIMRAIQQQAKLVRDTAAQEQTSIAEALKELEASPKKSDNVRDLVSSHPELSADEDLTQMHLLDGLLCFQSISSVESGFEKQIDQLKGLSHQAKNDADLQGKILVAHTLMEAAAQRADMNLVTQAAYMVMPLARSSDQLPIWQQPIPVSSDKSFPLDQMSPAQVTAGINQLSTSIGKTTLVWGFFPGFSFVDWVVHLTGAVPGLSYWLTALLLAIFVRGVIFPISQRQMMWSRQMQQLSPLINEIKTECKNRPDSQQEISQRTMALYKEYGMNPLSGCLPAFLQMPLFLLIYDSMLNYRFEFQKGHFLWINPGFADGHIFFARNLGERDYLLIIIYAITMVTTAMLTPVSDPSNVKQQRLMGIGVSGFFGIMMFFWPVPSAFILYWTFSNVLATAQSFRAYRLPLPPLVKKNAPNGGVYPTGGMHLGPSKEGKPSNGALNGAMNGKPKSTGTPKIHKPKKKK